MKQKRIDSLLAGRIDIDDLTEGELKWVLDCIMDAVAYRSGQVSTAVH